MPKFIYTVAFLAVVSWTIVILCVFKLPPSNVANILLFILLFFAAFSFTLSIPLFFLFKKRSPVLMKERSIYKKAAIYACFGAFFVVTLMVFRAFNMFGFVPLAVFLLIYGALYLQIRHYKC